MADDPLYWFRRVMAELHDSPDYPTSHVNLIDALCDYIEADKDLRMDIYLEGDDPGPDSEQMQMIKRLYADLRDHEFDPTLHGRVKERKDG